MVFNRYNIVVALLMFVVLILFVWEYIGSIAYIVATAALFFVLLILQKRRIKEGGY